MYSVYTYYFNNQRETGVAMLIPDKVTSKQRIYQIQRDV